MHRSRFGEPAEASRKRACRGNPRGVQFRIAARKPAAIAGVRHGLVCERRERDKRGPVPLPAVEDVRVNEAEGRVRCDRDRAGPAAAVDCSRTMPGHQARGRRGDDRIEVDVLGYEVAQCCESFVEFRRFLRLDETQMPLGQGEMLGLRQAAQDRNAGARQGLRDQPAMPLAAHPVEDHADDLDPRVECRAAGDLRGGALRLAADVMHQHHRPAELRPRYRRSIPVRPADAGTPSNKPIRPSQITSSAPSPDRAARLSTRSGVMAQPSRLKLGRPVARVWKAGSM